MMGVKEYYEYLNKDCPWLIGINKLYDLVKNVHFLLYKSVKGMLL